MNLTPMIDRAIYNDPVALRTLATELRRSDLLAGAKVREIVLPIARAWDIIAWDKRQNWRTIADAWAQRLERKAAEIKADTASADN